ncbi:hypothetical protein [Streptomyces sp. NPDC057682]|uniref:hypothetical protein n=1 Tax=Streptomyces sp. NPDC057682 TaxID=3346210 RepID=UPI0036780AB7
MICPHCAQNLLFKERPGHTCSKCGRAFALDPRTNALGLSDLRVRRVLARITREGTVTVTPDQLWYALARTRLEESRIPRGRGGAFVLIGLVVGVPGLAVGAAPMLVVSGVLLVIGAGCAAARMAGAGRGRPVMDRAAFRKKALGAWRRVYGGLPPGVADDSAPPAFTAPGGATAQDWSGGVLLCTDPGIRTFLAANGLPDRCGVALAGRPDLLPARASDGPVVVLRDADASGELLARAVREALAPRPVIDAGPDLRTARALTRAVPLRERGARPGPAALARLTALGGFTEQELAWLGKGWRIPLIALPPARLLETAARRAGRAVGPGPERRRAAATGFMTWPAQETEDGTGER